MTANVPGFRLVMNGKDLSPKVRPRLISLTLTEKRGEEADELELVLDDSDGRLAIPPANAVLHLHLGWESGPDVEPGLVDKGSFRVDEIEHKGAPDQLVIRARSADFTSDLKIRREKSWRDTTLGAVVDEIAARNDLQARCAPGLALIAVPLLAQSRESDMALLRRLGREHDAAATVKRRALLFSPIGGGVTPSGRAIPQLVLTRRDGDQHSYRMAMREDAGGVTAFWHDRAAGAKKQVTVGTPEGAKRLSRTYASEEQARAAARAAQRRSERQAVTLDYTLALGRADLMPERRVTVRGFKAETDAGSWLVAEVSHSIGERGYTSGVQLERI
jgi:phage protein D